MSARTRVTLRTATGAQARQMHALIAAARDEGRLLPRTLPEIRARAERFVVAMRGRRIVACAELAPLSRTVAEVRSLAVDPSARGRGVGTMLVDDLSRRARQDGYEKLCAFTHVPAYFIHLGFSIVPHVWLPEKVVTDCVKCPLFQRCGQVAMVMTLEPAVTGEQPAAASVHLA
jgi:amino-acid N-acetyltransferase